MKKLNLIKFYWAGRELIRPKTDIAVDEPVYLAHIKLMGLSKWMNAFLMETMGMPIPNARRAARELWEFTSNITEQQLNAMGAKTDMPFTLSDHVKLERLVKDFEDEFEHDARELNIFSLSDIGTHSTTKLIDKAHRNLPAETVERLSAEVLGDIDEAGRCLGFDRPTAAGFHILRAVEPLIVQYYNKLTNNAVPIRSRNWGNYARQLRTHQGDIKIVGMIDHIREFYRNPIMHPEETLTSDQALSLFHTCLSAIVQLDAATEALP